MVKGYLRHKKPLVIGEFGCCTYQGAEDRGEMGWDIVDWNAKPPRLKAITSTTKESKRVRSWRICESSTKLGSTALSCLPSYSHQWPQMKM